MHSQHYCHCSSSSMPVNLLSLFLDGDARQMCNRVADQFYTYSQPSCQEVPFMFYLSP